MYLLRIGMVSLFLTLCCSVQGQKAQEAKSPETDESAKPTQAAEKGAAAKSESEPFQKEVPPVVTHHEIRVGGKVLHYTATVGTMPIRNVENEEIEANIFYIAYTLDNPGPRRPLMFSFNGGPGAASVWLHLGAIGPRRVKMQPDGNMPAPPFELVDNEQTWLNQTDLVFIDPVGTGFSRATKKDFGKKFWGVKGDIASIGEFIRLYLTRNQRWTAPLFLVGESYGTTRAAGLSGYLVDKGVALSGVVLVSSVLNFQTLEFAHGNDLPYVLYLPSYTATAWYHKKLPADLQQRDLPGVLRDAEQFAAGRYSAALAKGDALSAQERQQIAGEVARFTALEPAVVEHEDLRLKQWVFCRELMRNQKKVVGRLDSRFIGADLSGVRGEQGYDPAIAVIIPPFTATFNNYVRSELGYKSDLEYYVLGGGVGEWDWGSAGQGFPDTSESLRLAFVKNPYMKLFVASGYFDLATPYFATQYTLNHMELDAQQHEKVSLGYYDAGHMMYIKTDSLDRLKRDVAAFLASSLR